MEEKIERVRQEIKCWDEGLITDEECWNKIVFICCCE